MRMATHPLWNDDYWLLVLQLYLKRRVFKNRIKIWYKKWCYIGVSKLLIFNTLTYKIALCKFA